MAIPVIDLSTNLVRLKTVIRLNVIHHHHERLQILNMVEIL